MIGRHLTRRLTPLLAALVTISIGGRSAAEELRLPITVSAKTITSGTVAAPNATTAMQRPGLQRTEPTLPPDKLPQYQMGYRQDDLLTADQRRSGVLFLKVALPDRPLLIKVTVQIDGKPFSHARQLCVEQMLAAMQASNDQPGELAKTESPVDAEPAAASEYRLASDPSELLRRYVDAAGDTVSADEARWLLANWADGPELLLLKRHFQSFRAHERPVFYLLDRDRDDTVSSDELDMAVKSFQECDFNGDGIVDVIEIERAAKDPRRPTADHSEGIDNALLTLVSEPTAGPDMEVSVDFDSADLTRSNISLLSIATNLEAELKNLSRGVGSLTFHLGQWPVTLSAVQGTPSDQISLGAVVDGYPMLPVIDPNNDGRFTLRELRSLVSRLEDFDVNDDGQLTADEAVATTRVCFGFGPVVHRELANLRDVPTTDASQPVDPPQWFQQMDRNGDNDLTRDEFPGTEDQFGALDADHDDLISAAEALALDQKADTNSDQ